MKRSAFLAIGTAIISSLVLVCPVLQATAAGQVFAPSDKTSATNPCPDKGQVPDSDYADFRKLLTRLLGTEAGVIDDIDAQVKRLVPADEQHAVTVEIYVVDKAEFQKEFSGDVDTLYPEKKAAEIESEARGIFDRATAYTYITKPGADGKQKVKIKVFCKDDLRTGMIDGSMVTTIIHELVHAKLYTLWLLKLGKDHDDKTAFPYPDHGDDAAKNDQPWAKGGYKEFYDEVTRLVEKAKHNLKLAYAPNTRLRLPLLATLDGYDPDTGVLIVSAELSGAGTFVTGSPTESNGLTHVNTEIISLDLAGGGFWLHTQDLLSRGTTTQKSARQDFPVASFFDVFCDVDFGGAKGSGASHLQADAQLWPPFGTTYHGSPLRSPLPGPAQPDPGQPPPGSEPPGPGPIQPHYVATGIEAGGTAVADQAGAAAVPVPVARLRFVITSLSFPVLDSDGDGVPDYFDPTDNNPEHPLRPLLPFRLFELVLARE